MEKDLSEIERIEFGVYSAEEIRKMAVCQITSAKICGADKNASGTVYDPRMGAVSNGQTCPTCVTLGVWGCPGHFGYIELNEPLVHPLFYRQVTALLKCFCFKCFSLLLTEEQIKLDGFNKVQSTKRLALILDKLAKVELCHNCGSLQPIVKYSTIDNTISLVHKLKNQPISTLMMTTEDIRKIFDNITDDDVRLLGFDPKFMHPRNLILTAFPVLPTCARPFLESGGGLCDDDLTIQVSEIVKVNEQLKTKDDEHSHQRLVAALKSKVSCFYNNSGSKQTTNGGRPIKGLKERISGKGGYIRSNLLAKRSEQTGRTVIGPDPTLRLGQLGLPKCMADNLSIPVHVNAMNIDHVRKLMEMGKIVSVAVDDGKVNKPYVHATTNPGSRLQHGDTVIRGEEEIVVNDGKMILEAGDKLKRGGILIPVVYPSKKPFEVKIGDICERRLMDNDVILLNRYQKSLFLVPYN